MRKGEVEIVNNLGLHARAAAKLIRLAETSDSDIKLTSLDGSNCVDAKSILSVLTLAASKGTKLILEIDGEDENRKFDEISRLFIKGFGELD